MKVTYTQKLKDYMMRKGYTHIVVDLVDSATSTSGFTDICGRFVKDEEAAAIAPKAARVLEGELGTVIVTARALEYDEEITLGLRSFFGLKDITFKGMAAFKL